MIDGSRYPSETRLAHDIPPERHARPSAPSSFGALAGARTPLDAGEASHCLARAWQSVLGEPAPAPALELARGGYFTADPNAYRRGIERIAAEHARGLGPAPAPIEGAIAVGELVEGVLASLRPRGER